MDWKLYKSQVVLANQRVMISILNNAIPSLGGIDSTWSYDKYNVFGLTSPTQVYYDLFNELRGFVYDYTKPKQLWMQAWVNYHMPDQVLQWHNHEWPIHGYISIRPHKTKTVFEGYEIDNEVGNVYIGPGNTYHRVEVLEDYNTPRITLGFDLLTDPTQCSNNIGLIPFPK